MGVAEIEAISTQEIYRPKHCYLLAVGSLEDIHRQTLIKTSLPEIEAVQGERTTFLYQIVQRRREMANRVPTKGFSRPNPEAAMLSAPLGVSVLGLTVKTAQLPN